MGIIVYQDTEKSVCPYVCMCVCGSDKLPAAILIRMGPNLDTTCISKMSRGTFLEFPNFEFLPQFCPEKAFFKAQNRENTIFLF